MMAQARLRRVGVVERHELHVLRRREARRQGRGLAEDADLEDFWLRPLKAKDMPNTTKSGTSGSRPARRGAQELLVARDEHAQSRAGAHSRTPDP